MSTRVSIQKLEAILASSYPPQNWWPAKTRFEVCVGAILTQNTAWTNVEKAITNLKSANAITAKDIIAIDIDMLAALIRPSGYYNQKAKKLKRFAKYYHNRKFKNKPTEFLRKELLELNGIGPETADSILLYALLREVFVVDAYTRRILLRHNLISENAKYEEIRAVFESALKGGNRVMRFNELHAKIVLVAKEHCRAKPVCVGCPLGKLGKI